MADEVLESGRDGSRHIVDVLIEERAPNLSSGPLWPLLRPVLYRVLDYAKAVRMADAISVMGGAKALEFVSELLDVRVEVSGLERAPRQGRVVFVCNHPTGIADGVAVYDALKPIRPDILFYANSDAHRVCPQFDEVLIPVEWVEAKRTRDRTRLTLEMSKAAFEAEKALMIFPAGRLARRVNGVLTDPEWMSTAISLARKHGCPVVPMHLDGPYAALFHFFDRFSKELRDITLFHELLNKRGKLFRLTIGQPIPAEALTDAAAATLKIKRLCEADLARDPDAVFEPSP
jgi:putative hemolysin